MKILVDIGGTYARFAVGEKGKARRIKKYAAADFPRFEDALAAYREEVGAGKKIMLLMATAAHLDGKVWRFVNQNKWIIDLAILAKKGCKPKLILNDFEAATWGLVGLKNKKTVKSSRIKTGNFPRCLIGPGTGLGLGYLVPLAKGFDVRKTMGGHMAAAAVTVEQELIVQTVRRLKKRSGLVVYEDLVSGQGLYDIYAALCEIDGRPKQAHTPVEMLEGAPDAPTRAAIRLFHEFFALFAATATVAGDAFGGLYLTGGVTDRLAEKNLFDFAHFEKFFAGEFVPSIHNALDATPVFHVTDPYIALKGLLAADA